MSNRSLQTVPAPREHLNQLNERLRQAREALNEAEAELASEQGAVNAFRMQCRLKLGIVADTVQRLRTRKQSLITRLQLLYQAQELGVPHEELESFWQEDEPAEEESAPQEDEGLPELYMGGLGQRSDESPKRLYRQLARRFHPDLANDEAERDYRTTMMSAVNAAYTSGDVETLRDLAGELDPESVAELSRFGDHKQIRKLRDRILSCQRRRRRVWRQLKALRRENTAKLWRRAQALEEAGLNWWDEVLAELEEEQAQLEVALSQLDETLKTLEAEAWGAANA